MESLWFKHHGLRSPLIRPFGAPAFGTSMCLSFGRLRRAVRQSCRTVARREKAKAGHCAPCFQLPVFEPAMNSQHRKSLPGTALDYFDAQAAVDAIQPGAYATLPYVSRVLAENLVRRCQPARAMYKAGRRRRRARSPTRGCLIHRACWLKTWCAAATRPR
ncbi:hypothetical protein STPYR_10295 [uncultured Stenotrophomonas sp.]|uniref:Uncharacterized protein n=1 Tax=uncultured Stenotrophomonas sp. TaxID=165438 RepID=A0A1Y5Q3J9_9GAMM|nr:hypothetical protein STPYR_10295 [uncultured Stenotrophomonas sp.]